MLGRRLRTTILLLSAFTLFAGGTAASSSTRWLVLLYFAADNDLQTEYAGELAALNRTCPPRDVEVVVLFDRGARPQLDCEWDRRLPRWRGARAFRLGACGLETLWTADDWNTGSPDDLRRFVEDATSRCRAQRTALFLIDHGHPMDGTCVDEGARATGDDPLHLEELRDALTPQVDGHGPLDLLVFASCQMGVVETVLKVADRAQYVIAGEDLLWTHNFDYAAMIERLACRPCADGRGLGDMCLDTARCVNDPHDVDADPHLGARQYLSVLSLVDCSAAASLGRCLGGLGQALHALRATGPTRWAELIEMRAHQMDFACECFYLPSSKCDGRGGCYIDLAHLVRGVREAIPGAVEPELLAAERAIGKAVLRSTDNPLFDRACGLGIMMPSGVLPIRYAKGVPDALRPWLDMLVDFERDQPKPAPLSYQPRLVRRGGTFRFPGPSDLGVGFDKADGTAIVDAHYGFFDSKRLGARFSGFIPLSRGIPQAPGTDAILWPHVVGENGAFALPVVRTVSTPGAPGHLLASSLLRRTMPSGETQDVVLISRLGPEGPQAIGVGRRLRASLPVAVRLAPGDRLTPYDLKLDEAAASIVSAAVLILDAGGSPVAPSAGVRLGQGGLLLDWRPLASGESETRIAYRPSGARPRIEAPAR